MSGYGRVLCSVAAKTDAETTMTSRRIETSSKFNEDKEE
jgi:hypothetical protein